MYFFMQRKDIQRASKHVKKKKVNILSHFGNVKQNYHEVPLSTH